MFTGIIEEVGEVVSVTKRTDDMVLSLKAPELFPQLNLGDSLAVNGACLTVTRKTPPSTLSFDVSGETLSRTQLGNLKPGDPVNLEPALTLNKALGGHLVSGHVDGPATLSAIKPSGEMVEMTFEVSEALADLMTVKENFGVLSGLKMVYIGDGRNNVANSWLNLASRLPMNLVLGTPEGFEPDKEILSMAKKSGISQIELYHNPKMAAKSADVIYTDVWASMGQEKEREIRREIFKEYQIDDDLLKLADDEAIVMHCLPAHRGEEITDSVLDGPHSVVFDQAENRLHVQKAIMVKLLSKE
jgi:riboflavin synthase alpha subunit